MTGPGGERWEVYTVLADAGAELEGKSRRGDVRADGEGAGCCGTAAGRRPSRPRARGVRALLTPIRDPSVCR